MKITVDYLIRVEKDIEVTPEEYCQIHANHKSRPDIFPDDCFDVNVSYGVDGLRELEDYLTRKDK